MVDFVTLPTRAEQQAVYDAAFTAGIPGWTADPQNDPLTYIAAWLVGQGFLLRDEANALARSVTLGLATGTHLDLLMFIPRLTGELDAAYLQRQRDDLETVSGFSNARLRRLVQQVTGVADAGHRMAGIYTFTAPTTLTIDVSNCKDYTIPIQGTGYTAASDAVLSAVRTYLNSEMAESYFAEFTVGNARRIGYGVTGTVIYDDAVISDLPALRIQLRQALDDVMLELRRINGRVYDSDMYARIWQKVPVGIKDLDFTLTRPLASTAAVLGNPVVDTGRITSIPVNDMGDGYVATPLVVITEAGHSGTAAEVEAVIRYGKVVEIRVIAGGTGYNAPTASLNPVDKPPLMGDMREQDGVVYVGAITDVNWNFRNATRSIIIDNTSLPPPFLFSPPETGPWTIGKGNAVEITLPPAVDPVGGLVLVYAMPSLPPGLTFDATNRQITGMATTFNATQTDYNLVATAAGGWRGVLPVPITVLYVLSILEIDAQNWPADTQVSYQLPPATTPDGTPTITYDLTPALPPGLTWTPATRTISGTPTQFRTGQTYTYRATATDYLAAERTFSIAIPGSVPQAPVLATSVSNDTVVLTWTAPTGTGGVPITGYVIQQTGHATATYNLSGNGLTFTTPTLANGTYQFTVAAINSIGTGTASNSESETIS